MSDSFDCNSGFGSPLSPRKGKYLNRRYQLEDQLGAGTWRAYEQLNSEFYIVHFLPGSISGSPQEFLKFKNAAVRLKTLGHPNLVSPIGVEEDPLYGAYLLTGSPVGRPLDQFAPGEIGSALIPDLIGKIANALDHLRSNALFHLRVKPSNIMVDLQNGELKNVYLTDTVTGRLIDDALVRARMKNNQSDRVFYYAAPEVWKGRPGAFSDQFSLACVAYELLNGSLPFSGSNLRELRDAILGSDPPDLTGSHPRVNEAIQKALSKDPTQRYDLCLDFARDLVPPAPAPIKKKKKTAAKLDQQGVIAIQGEVPADTGSVLDQMRVYHAGQEEEEEPDHSRWVKLGVVLGSCLLLLIGSWFFWSGGSSRKMEMNRNGSRPGASVMQKIGLEKENRSALNEIDSVTVMKKKSAENKEAQPGTDSENSSADPPDDDNNASDGSVDTKTTGNSQTNSGGTDTVGENKKTNRVRSANGKSGSSSADHTEDH